MRRLLRAVSRGSAAAVALGGLYVAASPERREACVRGGRILWYGVPTWFEYNVTLPRAEAAAAAAPGADAEAEAAAAAAVAGKTKVA